MSLDRIKTAFAEATKSTLPRLDYQAFYRARVLGQSADGTTVDLQPDSQRLPMHTAIPLRHGIPGCVAKVAVGAYVLLGWADADPQKPYAMLWEGGETVTMLTLGAATATDAVIKGTTYRTAQSTLDTALTAFLAALTTYVGAIKSIADPSNAASPPMLTAITTMTTAVNTFEGGAATYLSQIVKVQ